MEQVLVLDRREEPELALPTPRKGRRWSNQSL